MGSPDRLSSRAPTGSLDDTQFVTLLYNNALHRAPDPGGLAYWLDQLTTGMSRNDVVLGFSESAEQKGDQQAGLQDFIHFQDQAQSNVLDGGAGTDTASYAAAQGGVTVSLAISGPQETFGAGIDTLKQHREPDGLVVRRQPYGQWLWQCSFRRGRQRRSVRRRG